MQMYIVHQFLFGDSDTGSIAFEASWIYNMHV
jgi:hypothetical protein